MKRIAGEKYAMNNITCDLAPFAQTLNTCSHLHSMVQSSSPVHRLDEYSSILQVKSKPANAQPSTTIAKRPWRGEPSSDSRIGEPSQQSKERKYNAFFIPKDCAATGGCGLPT